MRTVATETAQRLDPPECSLCGEQMELRARGTDSGVPVVGSEIEYQRFACPSCGQGIRFERSDPDGKWQRAGV